MFEVTYYDTDMGMTRTVIMTEQEFYRWTKGYYSAKRIR
jgi:hypothetical protein